MSTLPRALHRARLWTTGVLTASTVLVGALGIHLADAHAQSVAARTSSSGTSSAFGSGSSDSSSGSSGSSGRSGSFDRSSGSGSDQGSSSGFSPVSPVGAGGFQAQTNSGGS